MYTSEIKVTFWWNIRNVCGNLALFAKLPDFRGSCRIVDSGQHHVHVIEVRGYKFTVDKVNLAFLNTIRDFVVQPFARRNHRDFGIGVKDIDYPSSCYLINELLCKNTIQKFSYLSASNYKNSLVLDLPGKY